MKSSIKINGTSYDYLDSTVIGFVEGLIGLPDVKHAVLVEDPEFHPFHWLASTEDETHRFIVVEPNRIFPGFDPADLLKVAGNGVSLGADTVVLAIVNISSEWKNTTFNLRAPILLNPHTRVAAQIILSSSDYQLAEQLPQ